MEKNRLGLRNSLRIRSKIFFWISPDRDVDIPSSQTVLVPMDFQVSYPVTTTPPSFSSSSFSPFIYIHIYAKACESLIYKQKQRSDRTWYDVYIY